MKSNVSILPVVMRSTPRYVYPLAKAFLRKFMAEKIDYNDASGRSKRLALVTFRITPICNLACRMCGQRGVTGVLKGAYAREEAKKIVPIERYMALADELAAVDPILYIWGGEPFLYPGFMDLAAYMAKKCSAFTVNTNGTYLAENAERIVRDRWGGVYVSLDGVEEVNDPIRGKGTYRRVVEGFEALNREKERQGSKLPYLGLVTCVSNLNYMHLESLVQEARTFKLSWQVINFGTYSNRKVLENQRVFMQKTFGIQPKALEGYVNGYNEGIDGKAFEQILARVQKLNYGYPILCEPSLSAEKIDKYYNDLEAAPRDHCICPWVHSDIDYNGDVHFCVDFPEYVIGNIKEKSFFEIYNGERAVRFRKTLRADPDGIFPGCTRCYQLMLLGRKNRSF
jgi:radical SAM protein with 4Fe4S-binding SPASM domain